MSMKDILTKISLLESKQSKEPVVENWTDFEDAKKAHEQFGGKVTGRPDDYTVTTKDGERRRYITKDGKRKIERLPPVAASHDDDDEDSKPKKEVKVKKDKKEVEPAEGAKRRSRPPGSKNKKKISEMTDAEWHLVMRRVAVMERTLSEPEKKKKEDIAKSMKDSPEKIADLKKRYGKRWKEVVYATATKKAKELKESQDVAEEQTEESALQAYLGKKKYGDEGMKALQQAGREGASKEEMAKIRARHDKMDEQQGVAEGFSTDPTQPGTYNGHKIISNRKTPKGSFLILQNKNDGKYEIHRQTPNAVGGLEFMSVHKTPDEMQAAFKKLTGIDESNQGVAEGLPGSLSKSDYTSGKTVKHTSSNCTACHGRKTMYKLDGKLYADNKAGATKVKCPTCKGTGDKQGVAEADGSFSIVFYDAGDDVYKTIAKGQSYKNALKIIKNNSDQMYDEGDHLRKISSNIYVHEPDYKNTGERASANNYKHMYHWIIKPEASGQVVAEGKGSKPDFLDVDKDGNRKESFKKAVKDKETIKEGGMAFQEGDYVYFGSQEGTIERFDGDVAIIQKRNGDLTAAKISELSSEKPGMMKKAASWMIGDSLQEEAVDEEDVGEGNEFSGELAKAKAAGQKEFEVDGKTYPVKEDQLEECGGDMSYGPGMPEQKDKVNVNANMSSDGTKTLNVTAEGDAAAELAQLLKLSGMLGDSADHKHPGAIPVVGTMDAEGAEELSKMLRHSGMKDRAGVEEEYANEPEEKVAGVAAVTKSGTDLHREKQSYSDRPYRGDNPMLESLEQKLWTEFQKAKQK